MSDSCDNPHIPNVQSRGRARALGPQGPQAILLRSEALLEGLHVIQICQIQPLANYFTASSLDTAHGRGVPNLAKLRVANKPY